MKVHRHELNICLGSVSIKTGSQVSLFSRVGGFVIVSLSINLVCCFQGNLLLDIYF